MIHEPRTTKGRCSVVFDTRLTHACSRNNLMNMSNLLDDIQVKVATLSARSAR